MHSQILVAAIMIGYKNLPSWWLDRLYLKMYTIILYAI